MRKYNINTYKLYKQDVEKNISKLPDIEYDKLTRTQLITKFMPLVENIAKKFSTASQASGTLDILDIIQEGSVGLIKAIDRIDWQVFNLSEDKEKTMKSFLSKRIRGAIRRSIDMYRGDMRIPEHKLNDIRNNFENEKNSELFFNSMFQSIDATIGDEENMLMQIPDTSDDPMKKENLSYKLMGVMKDHLTEKEYHVIRLSYGINCDKRSAKEIANYLNMNGVSSYVRVSQLKKQAIDKLKNVLDYSQVIDYL